MGSIYKRGNIYWIKYYRCGKPYRESSESKKEPAEIGQSLDIIGARGRNRTGTALRTEGF